MALSEINIKESLLCYSKQLILESDYLYLRRALLERRALPSIIHAFDLHIHKQYTTDQQNQIQQLTQQAITAQTERDNAQRQSDQQQGSEDYALTNTYTNQRPIIHHRLHHVTCEYAHQQQRYYRAQNQTDDLKRALYKLEWQTTQSPREQQLGYTTQHHTQYQFPAHIVEVPNQPFYHHYSQQIENTDFFAQERQRLRTLITQAERYSTQQQRHLDSLAEEKKHLDTEYSTITHHLDVLFPQQEQQRQQREMQRHEREQARMSGMSNEQLSTTARDTLQQEIQLQCQELETLREQLKDAALIRGYTSYTEQLASMLQNQPETLAVTFAERQSLRQLSELMNTYTTLEEQNHAIQHNLTSEQNKLTKLYRFQQENQHLTQENSHLELKRTQQLERRNSTLFLALFGTQTGIAFSGAASALLVINPLFLIVPVTFVLALAASVITAIVYHYKKANTQEQISANQQKIIDNKTTFFRQTGFTPESTPELNIQIEQVQQEITELQTESTTHNHRMGQLYQQAHSLEIQGTYSTNLFSQPADNIYPFPPSAPPAEALDNRYNYP